MFGFRSDGGRTLTFSPSGTVTTTNLLTTDGEVFWRDSGYDSGGGLYDGYAKNDSGYTSYSSGASGTDPHTLWGTVTHGGSITSTYDAEGELLTATGSLTATSVLHGSAQSHAVGNAIGIRSQGGDSLRIVAETDFLQDRVETFNVTETQTLTPSLVDGVVEFDQTSSGLRPLRSLDFLRWDSRKRQMPLYLNLMKVGSD